MKIKKTITNKYFEICSSPERWEEINESHIPEKHRKHESPPNSCENCKKDIKELCDRGETTEVIIDDWELYDDAIDQWGVNTQMGMLIEECAELIVATNKLSREVNGINKDEFLEELVDVEIMLEQMKRIFRSENTDMIKEKKLKRLEKILGEDLDGGK